MEKESWVCITPREQALLRQALARASKSKRKDAPEMMKLSRKLLRRSVPKITVGVKGGMVYWMTGNSFPIRICDYDIDGVYPEYKDELGRPCVISFAPEDKSPKRSRFTVCD